MKQDATRNAAYTVDCEDYVHVVEFNPFDSGDSGNLIAYGGGNYVVVGVCTFQVSVQNSVNDNEAISLVKKTNFGKLTKLGKHIEFECKKKNDVKNYRGRYFQ